MAESQKHGDMQETLKSFYKRASEAEDRLSRLEAALAEKKDDGNEELLNKMSYLESKLAEKNSDHKKAEKQIEKLAVENAKLQYRIIHLVRALNEADKLGNKV